MKIRQILIKKRTKIKILCKHGVNEEEVCSVFEKRQLILKSRDGRYIAIGCPDRYITVVFKFNKGTVSVITAYLSSENQIKLYKRKIR